MRLLLVALSGILIFAFMALYTFTRPLPFSIDWKNLGSATAEFKNHSRFLRADSEDNRLVAQVLSPTQVNIANVVTQDQDGMEKLFSQSKQLLGKLSACLAKDDRCGQAAEKNDPYFDPDRTIEHRNLNRVLMTLKEIIQKDSQYYESLNREDLINATKINNDNTALLALQVLSLGKISDSEISTMLVNSKQLRGQVRSLFLQEILNEGVEGSSNLRGSYVTAVYEALSNKSDRSTAFEIQKNLGRFKLEKSEFLVAVSKSCYLRKDDMGEDLWPILKKNISMQGEAMGYSINPDEYCK